MRFTALARVSGSLRASRAILVARSRNSSGYLRGATMIRILPGFRCLHQTRGGSRAVTSVDATAPDGRPLTMEVRVAAPPPAFRSGTAALVRAVARPAPAVPWYPNFDD